VAGAVRFETWMGSELTVVFVRVWVREYGRVAGDDGFDGALRLGAIGVVWVDAISYYSDPP
jgi:hypothetical protein